MTYATVMARRHAPDEAQFQVVLGTVFGRGRLVAAADGVRLVVAVDVRHAWLLEWTYERLAPLATARPRRGRDRLVVLRSEPHPLFAELAARLDRPVDLAEMAGPLGLRLWALHARLAACERDGTIACACAPAKPLRRRALLPAS